MIIDTPWNTSSKLSVLTDAGVKGIIRYYNHRNSSKLPEKRVTPAEAHTIVAANLSLAVVFQQRQDRIADFNAPEGERAGARARRLALELNQPRDSAVYVAVDSDFHRAADLRKVTAYFRAFARNLNPTGAEITYKLGAYGGGFMLTSLRDADLIDYLWVSMSRGFRGTEELLNTGDWHLAQLPPPTHIAGIGVDKNETNPRFNHDFGQFDVLGERAAAPDKTPAPPEPPIEIVHVIDSSTKLTVTARRGLRLRTGPGIGFEVLESLPAGTVVFEKSRSGDWVCVDLEGDGLTDGYLHSGFLVPTYDS